LFLFAFIACQKADPGPDGTIEVLHPIATVGQTRWYPRFSYIVGPAGLPAGGALKLFLPRAMMDIDPPDIQVWREKKVVTLSVPNRPECEILTHSRIDPVGLFELDFTLPGCDLSAQARLVLNFDQAITPKKSGSAQISGMLDRRGLGRWQKIPSTATITVYPAMKIRAPHLVRPNIPFDLVIDLDPGATASPYSGTVEFHSNDPEVNLPPPYTFTAADQNRHTFVGLARIARFGSFELTAYDQTTSQIFSRVRLACGRSGQRDQLYFGDIHGHSELSDGQGSPESYYHNARDVEQLDFVALTDHDYMLTDAKWDHVRQLAAKFNDPGRFVSFVGFEWSHKMGDKHLIFRDAQPPLLRRNDPRADHPRKLFEAYRDIPVIMTAHHPQSSFRPTDWFFHDAKVERLVEIYSLHGRSEYYRNPNPITPRTPPHQKYTTPLAVINVVDASVQAALARGYQLGISGGGDKHDAHPGDLGLVAVYAPELRREPIFDALYQRHCFATTNARIVLDFSIDDHFMGEEFTSDQPVTMNAAIIGAAPLQLIELIRNNLVLTSWAGQGYAQEIRYRDDSPRPAQTFYYLRVTQTDGEMAWSSPIWVASPACDLAFKADPSPLAPPDSHDVRIPLRVLNLGQGECRNVEVGLDLLADSGQSSRIASGSLARLARAGEATLELTWPGSKSPGRFTLVAMLDPQGKIGEADESNNRLTLPILIPARTISRQEQPLTAPGGRRYAWKTVEFESAAETMALAMTAKTEFRGVPGRNPRLIDDNLAIVLDGVWLGWESPLSFNGSRQLGASRTITLLKPLRPGQHTLALYADETPTLERLIITAAPSLEPLAKPAQPPPLFRTVASDQPHILQYYFEDGLSVWRERLDDETLLIAVTFSKNYEQTSNIQEELRWFQGEISLRNCRYTVWPWRFQEESDHIFDDAKGRISFVARANKAAGLEIIARLDRTEESAILLDIMNGGEYFPKQTWLGDRTATHLPIALPLNQKMNQNGAVSPELPDSAKFHPSNLNSRSLAETDDNVGQIPLKLETYYDVALESSSTTSHFERILASSPQNVKIRNRLAKLYLLAGNLDKARAQLDSSIGAGLANAMTYQILGEWALKRQDTAQAEAALKHALELAPGDLRTRILMGQTLLESNKVMEALSLLNQIDDSTHSYPERFLWLGEGYLRQQDYPTARRMYENMIREAPNDHRAYVKIGDLALLQGRFDEAYATYKTALAKGADNDIIFTKSGSALEAKGDDSGALREYENGCKKYPQSRQLPFLAARLLEKNGSLPEARRRYEQAWHNGNEDMALFQRLGSLYETMKERDAAISLYQAAIKIHPDTLSPYLRLGRLYKQAKHYDDAVILLEQGRASVPLNGEILLLLAEVYRLRKQLDESRATLEEAGRRYPTDPKICRKLGRSYGQNGDFTAAVTKLKDCLKQHPKDVESLYWLGQWQAQTGALGEARLTWEECMTLDPTGKHGEKAKKALLQAKFKTAPR
jgi:tetratricopeptide (TPR) repeat protein